MRKDVRYLVAAVQAIVGYEWLISGANKLLLGSFPRQLGSTISDGLKGNPNGWYVRFIQGFVLPHSVAVGYVIELCELGAGVALLMGALTLCGQLPAQAQWQQRLALAQIALAAVAAVVCATLCANFHFWMGDGFISAVDPSHAFNEGIDLDTLLVPLAIVICVANAHIFVALAGAEQLRARVARMRHTLVRAWRPAVSTEYESGYATTATGAVESTGD